MQAIWCTIASMDNQNYKVEHFEVSTVPYSGYFSRGVYFADFAQRAQFTNFEISKLN